MVSADRNSTHPEDDFLEDISAVVEEGIVKSPDIGKCKTISFDAWKYGREEVLWTALIQTILSAIAEDEYLGPKAKTDVKKAAKRLLKFVGMYAAGALQYRFLGVPSEFLTGLTEKKWKTQAESRYAESVKTFNEFENTFGNLVESYVGFGGRLVVFIDFKTIITNC